MRRVIGIAIGVAGLTAAGCGAGTGSAAFSYRFADNVAEPTARVAAGLPAPRAAAASDSPLGKPIAVVSTHGEPGQRAVAAFDLTNGERLWSTRAEPLTRPEVHGDVVVFSARGSDDPEELVALDLGSGRELWRKSTEGQAFVGAARSGSTLVFVVSVGAAGGATRTATVAAVNARSGRSDWSHDLEGILGQPAIAGAFVFVPWERQNIAILDLATGVEQARLRSTDDVLAWVDATPAGVFYGAKAIYRFTPRSASGTKTGSTYRVPPIPEAPREPLVHDDGFMPKPGTRSARGRIRIYYEPAPTTDEAQVPVVGDTFYFVYYRYVFAFDLENTLRWVRIVDQTIAGAQVTPRGLLTVGEQGGLHLLALETGNDLWTGGFEAEVAAVSLVAPGFDAGGAGEPGERRELRPSLNEVALDPDNRLVPARAFAIDLLARMEEAEITRDLLDLFAQRSTPGALREAIGTSLRRRTTGGEFLVQALEQHYDYINDTASPPLGLIVPSLMEMGEARAVPGLIQQMMDHETDLEVLPLVVRAVVELGDESVVPPLREFLRLYHADSTFAEKPEALAAAAEGLFRLGGPEGREMLTALAAEQRTQEPLAAHVRGLFEREQRDAEARARAEADAATAAAAAAARQEEEARPLRLTQEQVNQTFAEHAGELRECILAELGRNPHLAQVRFVFILENDGRARDFTFAPTTAEFIACLQPKVTGIEFPKFRQRRQRGSFTISIRGTAAGPAVVAVEDDPSQPWWVRFRARNPAPASLQAAVAGPAWWISRPAEAPTMEEPVAQRPGGQQPGGQQPGGQQPGGQQPGGQQPGGQQPGGQQPGGQQPGGQQPGGQQPGGQQPGGQQPGGHEPEPEPEPENPWWLPAD